MGLATGTRLGPYEILAAVGAGGMGDVYKARDTRLDRTVAVKMIRETGGDTTRRILREARATARLNHPNIAALYDVVEQTPTGSGPALPFLVMEYVDGEPLTSLVAGGPCDVGRALDITIEILAALAYAHHEETVHRDVKPANVVLTRDGHVKLLDLGIAQFASRDATAVTRTATGLDLMSGRPGTPAYMAPEQLAGQPASARSDVYSTGVLLFELLTGRRPFAAPDIFALAMEMAAEPQPRVSTARPGLPPALDAVVARAMAREPEHRYPSAAAFRDDLVHLRDAIRNGTTIPVVEPAGRRGSRRRIAIAAAVLACLALATWVAAERWWVPRPPARVAILPAGNAGEDPEIEVLGATVVAILTDNLAAAPGLTVVSANPGVYRDRTRDTREAAKALGSGYLIDLRLRKAGTRVSVDGRIIDARTGQPVWRDSHEDEPLGIARHVAAALGRVLDPGSLLRVGLGADDRQRLQRLPTADARAWAAYLQGRTRLDTARDRAAAEQALAAFTDAASLDGAFALAYAGASQALLSLNTFTKDRAWLDQAVDASKRALGLDPNRALVLKAVARVDQATGQLDNAERHVREAVRIAPDDDTARRQLAAVLDARHDRNAAIEEARIAVRLRPNSVSNQYTLGFYCFSAGRYQDAIPALRRATELQPDSPMYFSTLGVAYQSLGDAKEAIGNFAQAIRLGKDAKAFTTIDTAMAYSNLGTAYYSAGQFDDAVANYREALRLNASSATTHRNLADAYQRQRRFAQARAEYQAALALVSGDVQRSPQDARSIALKAFCEAKLDLMNDAAQDIASALTLSHRTDKEVMFKSAVIQALAGHIDGALQDLDDALTLGYPVAFARGDWDLVSLRTQPKYTELVNRRKD